MLGYVNYVIIYCVIKVTVRFILTEKEKEIKRIENVAVDITKDYLFANGIDNYLTTNDKTPNIDGFIKIDSKDYNVQIKGTKHNWLDHDIYRKYFEYALSNFILYIIVDKITNGLHSKHYKIYYRTIDLKDAILGLNNNSKIKANKLKFKELNDITQFKKDVYDSYVEYSKREHKGININDFFLNDLNDIKLSGKITFEDNLIDVKNISVEKVKISNSELMIDQDTLSIFKVNDIVEKEEFVIPETNIKLQFRKNKITKIFELKYNDLKILADSKTKETKINITGLSFNPFNLDVYRNYKIILERFINGKNDELNSIYDFINGLIEFKEYLVDKRLFKEKYNKQEVLDFFYTVYKKGLQYQ